ncbi:MAG TPA: FtsX-like permease family protein [Natronosporangium sp.]|nr:FtsX-like permease family protein [Natronosporangium sp.]
MTVTSLAGVRDDIEHTGFHHGLTRLFVLGTVGAAVGGVLGMLLALVVPARSRGRELSLLRTMGLSTRQAPRLLLTELLPVSAAAIATGAAAGLALPLVLSGALHLGEFTGGAAYRPAVAPVTVVAMAAMLAVVVAVGVLVQAATNRRHGLGGVLRVD